MDRFSETRDWSSARVRCLAWHPHAPRFALALGSSEDDVVRVVHGGGGPGVPPVSPALRYKGQRGVSCLAWRPLAGGELAVGCLSGLLVWTVDPTSVAARSEKKTLPVLNKY